MSFQYPDSRILVFAKAPIAGQVKTRLHPALSPAQCAVLQARLIEHTLETCVNSKLCPVELWRADNAADNFFRGCAQRFDIALHMQCRGDLGADQPRR